MVVEIRELELKVAEQPLKPMAATVGANVYADAGDDAVLVLDTLKRILQVLQMNVVLFLDLELV